VRRLVAGLACLALVTGAPSALGNEGAHEILHWLDIHAPGKAPSPQLELRLRRAINAARQAGAPSKVALIDSREDMVEVEQYMGRPAAYARVLEHQIGYGGCEGADPRRDAERLATGGPLAQPLVDRALAGVRVDRRRLPDGLAARP
jgi:hypothetical protein